MRDERRMKEASKIKQTNNKAKQHSTPKAVTFPMYIHVALENILEIWHRTTVLSTKRVE